VTVRGLGGAHSGARIRGRSADVVVAPDDCGNRGGDSVDASRRRGAGVDARPRASAPDGVAA